MTELRPAIEVVKVNMARDDDCLQASLATILGLPLDAVPRFDEAAIPGKNQNGMARSWLKSIGYTMDVFNADRHFAGMHIKCGTSLRGCGHASVYDGNELYHDPHPEGGGIVGDVEENIIVRQTYPAADPRALVDAIVVWLREERPHPLEVNVWLADLIAQRFGGTP